MNHTQGRMHNLEQCKRLRPFCELSYSSVYVSIADEGYKNYDAAKYNCPKYSADKVVNDQILGLEATM